MFNSLLCLKTLYGIRRHGMQHGLCVMFLYYLFMVSFCNKYLWLHLCLPVCVLYCSKVVRFRDRGGVRCSNECKNVYTIISIFYKCIQTIKIRQTTENNGGPFMSKSDAKGVPWALKSYAKTVLTKLQYVTSWELDWVGFIRNIKSRNMKTLF